MTPEVTEISPRELKERLDAGERPLLLDVREAWELALARLPDTVHVPMAAIPTRAGELERDRDIVVICRVGARSLQVAHYLSRQGFPRVANLTGGIVAWAHDVDPSVQTY